MTRGASVPPVIRAAAAGVAYVAAVFAAGFVLGVLRTLVLAPALGHLPAVLAELPVMLALSWIFCAWLVARLQVPARTPDRVFMGGVALALLMAAEFAVSALAFGRALPEHLALYRDLPQIIGLAGQLAFAAFPLLQMLRSARRGR